LKINEIKAYESTDCAQKFSDLSATLITENKDAGSSVEMQDPVA